MSIYNDVGKIFDVLLAFHKESRYERLLEIVLIKMMEITNADAGTLYISTGDKLHFSIVKNHSLNISLSLEDAVDLPPVVLNEAHIENICAYAAIKNQVVEVEDVYLDNRFNFSGTKNYDSKTGYRTKSMITVPLCATRHNKSEVLGVIQLLNAINIETGAVVPFKNIYNPPVVTGLANMAANILLNIIGMRQMRELFDSFVSAMVQSVDETSQYSSQHVQNAARHCRKFAEYLGRKFLPGHKYHFDALHIDAISVAATLHDIGKISTPSEIMDKSTRFAGRIEGVRYRFDLLFLQLELAHLRKDLNDSEYDAKMAEAKKTLSFIEAINTGGTLTSRQIDDVEAVPKLTYNKNGKQVPILDEEDLECLSIRRGTLTPKERKIMEDHAMATGRLLDNIAFLNYYSEVPKWAKSHHEFLDGTGYPEGLKGDQISIETRIITITDIFEALVTKDRPYKSPLPIDRAIRVLSDMADDGKLDGELVKLFVESKVWEDNLLANSTEARRIATWAPIPSQET